MDFKGDFRLGDGKRCYPLTITDNHSRYLLACQALTRTHGSAVRPWFEQVFREYGLPWAIRSDNGSPFASVAVGGLSGLSKWWIDLGICPERIRPGRPDQNGRHERMHRSLKEAIGQSEANAATQQLRLDSFREEYNQERSHEGLARATPASVYIASSRAYPRRIAQATYDTSVVVRKVRTDGTIKWRGSLLYLSEVLIGEPVGLEPVGDGMLELRYRFHPLGHLDERAGRIVPARRWHGT